MLLCHHRILLIKKPNARFLMFHSVFSRNNKDYQFVVLCQQVVSEKYPWPFYNLCLVFSLLHNSDESLVLKLKAPLASIQKDQDFVPLSHKTLDLPLYLQVFHCTEEHCIVTVQYLLTSKQYLPTLVRVYESKGIKCLSPLKSYNCDYIMCAKKCVPTTNNTTDSPA